MVNVTRIPGGEPLQHPAVERLELRRRMATAIEGLLDAAHTLIAELGAELPDADLEPSLGAPEHPAHLIGLPRTHDEVFRWTNCANDDREADGDRWTACDADLEPSLGSTFRQDQRRWATSPSEDFEHEHDGREPQCEDEGAQCDGEGEDCDREPDESHVVPCHLHHDQTRRGTYFGEPA